MTKKIKELSVRQNGIEVGILKLVDGKMQFAYNPENTIQISMSLPLRQEPFKEKSCRAFFGGFLPEDRSIREVLARKYKIGNIDDDFKFLKEIGKDCAGAISFNLINEKTNMIEDNYELIKGKILTDDEVVEKIKELPQNPFVGSRISLAGVQTKAAFCMIDNKFAIPIDNVPTTHIVKPCIEKYPDSVKNEYICMKIAKEFELDVANVEIRKIKNLEIIVIERFDRLKSDNNMYFKRIPQEDFVQALGKVPSDKYEINFKDCLTILNKTSSPAKNKQKFIKQVIFNYLIGNNDAHGKNFSIMTYLDDIKLTPAYDILSTEIYKDSDFSMKIGNAKNRFEITEDDWKLFAQDLDVSYKLIENELKIQKEILPKITSKIVDELKFDIGYKILTLVKNNCKS